MSGGLVIRPWGCGPRAAASVSQLTTGMISREPMKREETRNFSMELQVETNLRSYPLLWSPHCSEAELSLHLMASFLAVEESSNCWHGNLQSQSLYYTFSSYWTLANLLSFAEIRWIIGFTLTILSLTIYFGAKDSEKSFGEGSMAAV